MLDEHISPEVAQGLRRSVRGMCVHALAEWEGGNLVGQDDATCLRTAAGQQLTLVTC